MKIISYKKKKNGIYEVLLENNEKVELYEDVILKYNLLISKEIDLNDKKLFDYNTECHVYYLGLKFLKNRTRSRKEVIDKLKDYDIEVVEKVVNKLQSQGYINELFFANSFLNNKLITTNNGPKKIRKDLQDKGINNNIIDEVMINYTDQMQQEKIKKIVNRMIKSNRNNGNIVLKKKIQSNLIIQGFSKNNIDLVLANTSFPSDLEIAKKEYDKLYKKYSSKYSGSELELKIRQKLFQKGLKY